MSTIHWTDAHGRTPTYLDGTLVPLFHYRCKSRIATTAHVCKVSIDHDGDHRCVCGTHWPNSQAAHA